MEKFSTQECRLVEVTEKERIQENHARMRQMIQELEAASTATREKKEDGTEILRTPEGELFAIRKLTDRNDPAVKKIHAILEEEFGEEAEELEWLKHSIDEGLNDYFVLENANGDIVTVSNTQFVPMKSGEGIITVWHILSDPAYRQKGLGRELYIDIYADALRRAEEDGRAVKGIIGESVPKVESFLNRMGRARLYFEDSTGNIHEVPYMCPPTNFDSETGEPDGILAPEHIMLRLVNGDKSLSTKELTDMVEVMYQEYLGTPDDYDNPEAFQRAQNYIQEVLTQLATALSSSKDGTLNFMSKQERKEKKIELDRQQKKLIEWGEVVF